MKPKLSYWEEVFFPENPDVIIIGAGIVGLSCALSLVEINPDIRILVLEHLALSRGASTRNAGFACFGSPSELLADLNHTPEHTVFQTVQHRFSGLQKLLNRVGRTPIDFELTGGQEIFFNEDKFESCVEKLPYLNEQVAPIIGIPEVYQIKKDQYELTGDYYSIVIRGEGYLHPGKLIRQLENLCTAFNVTIMKGMRVKSISQANELAQVELENGFRLFAPACCVCTNGFSNQILDYLALRPARNQVLLSESIPDNPLYGTYHHDEGYVYWRNVGNRLLIGGMRNLDIEGETTDEFGLTDEIPMALKRFVEEHIYPYPLGYDYAWSGIMGVGEQKGPIIKKTSESIVVAVRMGGMGVAIGTSVGEQAARLTIG